MVAVRNPDGTYDINEPGFQYQGLHPDFVPDHLKAPDVPIDANNGGPMLGALPDERLASNLPISGGQASNIQGALAAPPETADVPLRAEQKPNIQVVENLPPMVDTKEKANPNDLHFASGPATRADGTLPGVENDAYNKMLLAGARGSGGVRIPGGPQLAQEVWAKDEMGSKPRLPNESPEQYQSRLEDESNNRIDSQLTEQAVNDESQAAARRDTGRARVGAELADTQAQRELMHQADLNRQEVARREFIDEHNKKIQDVIDRMGKLAEDKPQEAADIGFGTRLGLSIGQGLLTMGSLMAGAGAPQGPTFVDKAIAEEVRKQQDKQKALQAMGAQQLSALGQLQSQFLSPEGAEHALTASYYNQAAKEGEAYAKRVGQGQLGDKANAMVFDMQQKCDAEALKAQEWEHKSAIQNVQSRVVGGQQSGWPGIVAKLNQFTKGMPQKDRDQITSQAWNDFQSGKPFAMAPVTQPVEPGNARTQHYEFASRVNLPAWTGHTGVAFISDDPETAKQVTNTVAQAQTTFSILDDLHELGSKAGHSLSPTDRAMIDSASESLAAKVAAAAKEGGMTDSKIESMQKRLGLHAYKDVSNVADLQKLTDHTRKDLTETFRALVPVQNMTRTFRGDDYLQNSEHEAQKVKEQ